MLNWRMLRAWPNWITVPVMLAFWIVTACLMAELLGASPYHEDQS